MTRWVQQSATDAGPGRRGGAAAAPDALLAAPELTRRLHAPLVALQAAMEVGPLWRSVRRLLRAAFAPHRVTLFLGHLGMGEARMVFTDPPIDHPEQWYAARGRVNPFSPYIEANRGLRFYRFCDVLPPRERFVRSEFYRRFARPEGWDKGVSALYWMRREVTAMFSLYRAPAQADFTEADLALLRILYPFIGAAVQRVQRLHTERLARRSLEEFNRNLPVGLVLLDWELRVEFANPEAQRLCARWNYGPAASRGLNPRDTFALPPAISEAARRLRTAILARDPRKLRLQPGEVALVEEAGVGLRSRVSVLNNASSSLARPKFLVILDAREPWAPGGEEPAERWRILRALTPREREIALLVREGQSNAEIAHGLSKSVLTIKTQLNSIFRKLGVKSRARLMARLR
ncbi:MAG: helix-turn-helix transcriptional regulator [Verrucomicrobia bacterium]|nr:helix-turn-helix transcriptional regulator [Verrucomicrobiota bacterium]